MAYSILFKRSAKLEVEECCHVYGQSFRTDLWQWLRQIAASAESWEGSDAVDLLEIIDESLQQETDQWRSSLRRWIDAPLREKIQAAIVVLKSRCPPWETRVTTTWLHVLGHLDCEVHAVFLVDRVNKRVTFVKFDGLPGQT